MLGAKVIVGIISISNLYYNTVSTRSSLALHWPPFQTFSPISIQFHLIRLLLEYREKTTSASYEP